MGAENSVFKGRSLKEDGQTTINWGEMIEEIHKALVSDKNAGVLLYDAQGLPLLTLANPGVVEIKDRADRILGKVEAQLLGSNALGAVVVTPADDADLIGGATKGLYLGAVGNVKVDMVDGTTVTFTALANGVVHPLSIKKVYDTDTTATGIVAIY